MDKDGRHTHRAEDFSGPSEDRRRATSVPNVAFRSLNITQADLDNHFNVTLSVAERVDVPERALGYPVVGSQTAEQLGGIVAIKLWNAGCICSPECDLEFFYQNGVRLLPSSTLAEALNVSQRIGGDGVGLDLVCVICGFWFGQYIED